MLEKLKTSPVLKKLLALGNAKSTYSHASKRAYRSSSNRYFWAVAALFVYFLLGAYLLGGGSGTSGNGGIFKLLFGAMIVGGLAAFLAPRLNEGLQGLLPSGRRNLAEQKKRSSQRRSRSARRSSQSSSVRKSSDQSIAQAQATVKTDL